MNLLGFDEFDFIEKVLSAREIILKSISASQGKNKAVQPPGPTVKIKTVEKLGKHYASEWEIQVDEFDSAGPQNFLKQESVQNPEFPHVYGGKKELNFGS